MVLCHHRCFLQDEINSNWHKAIHQLCTKTTKARILWIQQRVKVREHRMLLFKITSKTKQDGENRPSKSAASLRPSLCRCFTKQNSISNLGVLKYTRTGKLSLYFLLSDMHCSGAANR